MKQAHYEGDSETSDEESEGSDDGESPDNKTFLSYLGNTREEQIKRGIIAGAGACGLCCCFCCCCV